jgi:hypothetical protein
MQQKLYDYILFIEYLLQETETSGIGKYRSHKNIFKGDRLNLSIHED